MKDITTYITEVSKALATRARDKAKANSENMQISAKARKAAKAQEKVFKEYIKKRRYSIDTEEEYMDELRNIGWLEEDNRGKERICFLWVSNAEDGLDDVCDIPYSIDCDIEDNPYNNEQYWRFDPIDVAEEYNNDYKKAVDAVCQWAKKWEKYCNKYIWR